MEQIFALDIGTRMVMGLIMAKKQGFGYEILASAQTEHRQRAMYDGQVHDVDEVAKAVLKVKELLEKKLETSLTKVAVAAAGRSLRTEVAVAEHKELLPVRWERDNVLALELEAVHQALRQIKSSDNNYSQSYHCVGYNPIACWNEGEEIANLIGQRGREAKISVIATFLPRTVVDGLVAVLGRVGLEMTSLTLEPIAAGQAAIPHTMRRLNLALVDIGAGTSDIALTKNGSFFAYGMVPMAGDEVTEAICTNYLLDFQVGEKVKRELCKKERLVFHDFLGAKINVPKEDLLRIIEPAVKILAEKISQEILRLNNQVPQAIILIGGGSLTPMLNQMLAESLKIPENRVGLQVRERIGEISGEKSLKGPKSITPLGIGLTALEGNGLQYYTVTVNSTPVPIFELQLTTAAEALLAAGIQPRYFWGKPGAAITFEWNGQMQVIKGTLGSPAQLLINGQPAQLDQNLTAGDQITFVPGEAGEDAKISFAEVIPSYKEKWIYWNDRRELFAPQVYVDNHMLSLSDQILDGYKIMFIANDDLTDLLKQKKYNTREKLTIIVNGEIKTFDLQHIIFVNGCEVKNCLIHDEDKIEVRNDQLKVGDLQLQPKPLIFYLNGAELEFPPQETIISYRGRPISENEPLIEGMELRVGHKQMPIVADLMPHVNFPDHLPPGSVLTINVNGQKAEFTTLLHPGDRVTANWDKENY